MDRTHMRTSASLLVLLSYTAWGQTTFAPVGATWTYTQRYPFSADSAIFTLTCTGDTLIDGRICSVLQAGTTTCFHPYGGGKAFTYTSGDSVFVRSSTGFSLLHAFDAVAGSSWDIPWSVQGGADTIRVQVLSTGIEVIDGLPLRVLETESTMIYEGVGPIWPVPARITERLGHSIYLFYWGFESCDVDLLGPLRCYSDPLITWTNPQLAGCELGTGLHEITAKPAFTIAPNPATRGEVVQVRRVGTSAGQARVEVYDATGSMITSFPMRSQTIDLDLPGPGLFLIRVSYDAGLSTTQQVVMY